MLLDADLDPNRLTAVMSDTASVMTGKDNGAVELLRKLTSALLMALHCWNHCLDLCPRAGGIAATGKAEKLYVACVVGLPLRGCSCLVSAPERLVAERERDLHVHRGRQNSARIVIIFKVLAQLLRRTWQTVAPELPGTPRMPPEPVDARWLFMLQCAEWCTQAPGYLRAVGLALEKVLSKQVGGPQHLSEKQKWLIKWAVCPLTEVIVAAIRDLTSPFAALAKRVQQHGGFLAAEIHGVAASAIQHQQRLGDVVAAGISVVDKATMSRADKLLKEWQDGGSPLEIAREVGVAIDEDDDGGGDEEAADEGGAEADDDEVEPAGKEAKVERKQGRRQRAGASDDDAWLQQALTAFPADVRKDDDEEDEDPLEALLPTLCKHASATDQQKLHYAVGLRIAQRFTEAAATKLKSKAAPWFAPAHLLAAIGDPDHGVRVARLLVRVGRDALLEKTAATTKRDTDDLRHAMLMRPAYQGPLTAFVSDEHWARIVSFSLLRAGEQTLYSHPPSAPLFRLWKLWFAAWLVTNAGTETVIKLIKAQSGQTRARPATISRAMRTLVNGGDDTLWPVRVLMSRREAAAAASADETDGGGDGDSDAGVGSSSDDDNGHDAGGGNGAGAGSGSAAPRFPVPARFDPPPPPDRRQLRLPGATGRHRVFTPIARDERTALNKAGGYNHKPSAEEKEEKAARKQIVIDLEGDTKEALDVLASLENLPVKDGGGAGKSKKRKRTPADSDDEDAYAADGSAHARDGAGVARPEKKPSQQPPPPPREPGRRNRVPSAKKAQNIATARTDESDADWAGEAAGAAAAAADDAVEPAAAPPGRTGKKGNSKQSRAAASAWDGSNTDEDGDVAMCDKENVPPASARMSAPGGFGSAFFGGGGSRGGSALRLIVVARPASNNGAGTGSGSSSSGGGAGSCSGQPLKPSKPAAQTPAAAGSEPEPKRRKIKDGAQQKKGRNASDDEWDGDGIGLPKNFKRKA